MGQHNKEDVVEFLTTFADEFVQGRHFSNSIYNAEVVLGLRTSIFATGTELLLIALNNLASRGVTARGVCIFIQDLTRIEKKMFGMF